MVHSIMLMKPHNSRVIICSWIKTQVVYVIFGPEDNHQHTQIATNQEEFDAIERLNNHVDHKLPAYRHTLLDVVEPDSTLSSFFIPIKA